MQALSFAYRGYEDVLRNVSLRLEPGRAYILDGRNGSGKTTLAKLLCGVLRPRVGCILSSGSKVTPWEEPGSLVGYHFQNPDVQLFTSSVEEEVSVGSLAQGAAAVAQAQRVEATLHTFGLLGVLKEHPLDLPFALRKRVALAATIAVARPWLILDEPTLGQDRQSSEAIARVIELLVRDGTGVVVISHSEWFQQRLNASVLRLKNGELYADAPHGTGSPLAQE